MSPRPLRILVLAALVAIGGVAITADTTVGVRPAAAQPACSPTFPPPMELRPGQVASGFICPAGQQDLYFFDANQGEQVTITMSRSSGSALRPYLELWCCVPDNPGQKIAQAGNGQPTAQLVHTLPRTGRYAIRAGSLNGASVGAYVISLAITRTPTPTATPVSTPPPLTPLSAGVLCTPDRVQVGQQVSCTTSWGPLVGGVREVARTLDFGDGTTWDYSQGGLERHTYTRSGTYQVTFRVTVCAGPGTQNCRELRATTTVVVADPPPAQVTVRIWTDKPSYRVGDPIQVCFAVSQPVYIVVTDFPSDGTSKVIADWSDDGTGYCIPGTVTEPTGRERVRIEAWRDQRERLLLDPAATAEATFEVLPAAPQLRTCWDGSSVPVNQPCPQQQGCPDGSIVPVGTACPRLRVTKLRGGDGSRLVQASVVDDNPQNARLYAVNQLPLTVQVMPYSTGVAFQTDGSPWADAGLLLPQSIGGPSEAWWRAQWPNIAPGVEIPYLELQFETTNSTVAIDTLLLLLPGDQIVTAALESLVTNGVEKLAEVEGVLRGPDMQHFQAAMQGLQEQDFVKYVREMGQSILYEYDRWLDIAYRLRVELPAQIGLDVLLSIPDELWQIAEMYKRIFTGTLLVRDYVRFGLTR